MNQTQRLGGSIALALLLSACGGGGSSSSSSASSASTSTSTSTTTTSYPASGAYSWVLSAAGATATPQYGLTLGNPFHPQTAYPVESTSAAVSDAFEIDQGTVATNTGQVVGLVPYSLVYLSGGVLKTVSLIANGAAPVIQSNSALKYCKILVKALNYATAVASRLVVSTAGPDGVCGSADDAQALIAFNASGALVVTQEVAAGSPLTVYGFLRDPSTYAPVAFIDAQGLNVFGTTPASQQVVFAAPNALIAGLVSQAPAQALVNVNGALDLLTYTTGETTPGVIAVQNTSGGGWAGIGFDAVNFYVYHNVSNVIGTTYQVLAVDRSSGVESVLYSGNTGSISQASLGTQTIYLSVTGANTASGSNLNALIAINKGTAVATTLETSVSTTQSVALPTDTGLDFILQTASSPFASYITVIDQSYATVKQFVSAAQISYLPASIVNLNVSESRSQLVFLTGYGSSNQAAGAQLTTYDTATETSTVLGTLPAQSTFSNEPAYFASSPSANLDFQMGFITGVNGASFSSTGTATFSFNPTGASSLLETTVTAQ